MVSLQSLKSLDFHRQEDETGSDFSIKNLIWMSFGFSPLCWTRNGVLIWKRIERNCSSYKNFSEIFSFAGKVQHFPSQEMWWQCLYRKHSLGQGSVPALGSSQVFSLYFVHISPKLAASGSHQCFGSKPAWWWACSDAAADSHCQLLSGKNFW